MAPEETKRRPIQGIACTALGGAITATVFYAVVALNHTAAAKPPQGGEPARSLRLVLPPVEETLERVTPPPKAPSQKSAAKQPVPDPQPVSVELQASLPGLSGLSVVLGGPKATPAATGASPPPAPKVFTSGQVDQPAAPLSPLAPPYPEAAKRRRIEGLVRLRLLVDEAGQVRSAAIVSGPALLASASMKFARRLTFSPARHRGRKVQQWVNLPLRFRLR